MNDANDPPLLFSSLERVCLLCDLVLKELCSWFHSLLISFFASLNTVFVTVARLKYFLDVFHWYGTNTTVNQAVSQNKY